MTSERLRNLLSEIDRLNGQDPNIERAGRENFPRELLYSRRLTDWVLKLEPGATERLQIAARGQHLQRWKIPRASYPSGRGGYLRWREALKRFHADQLSQRMIEAGYSDAEIEQVKAIVLKKNLKEPETQTIEDALCLVFLETQFSDLKRKTPDDKMRTIIKKTWLKMSKKAQDTALRLPFDSADFQFLQSTLSEINAPS